jgi:hypothetical protein
MKLFVIAFGIACGCGVILFVASFAILTRVGIEQAVHVATALGGLSISAFPKIAEFLEQQEGKKGLTAGKHRPVYDFRGFQIAWPLMMLYGTLLLLIIEISSFSLGGAIVGFIEDVEEVGKGTVPPYFFAAVPLIIVGAYLTGRWIGTRCSQKGTIVLLTVIVLNCVLFAESEIIPGWVSSSVFTHNFGPMQKLEIVLIIFISGPLLLIGYWRGRKHRLSKYLYYLLGVLPKETRHAVIELAVEEAQRAASATAHP